MLNTAFKVDIIDRVIFSRWLRPPSKQDIEAMEAHMAAAHKRLGQKLLYVGSIDSKVKVPNAEERNNLNTLLNAARNYCEVAHVIIEGSDLQNSLQRVIISGMLIVTRTYDNYMSVHKTIDGAVPDLAKRLNKDVSSLVRVARDRGLVQ
ncbi:DofB protein [Hyalangium versicolor]|uniref:DofB protein n=1 Tax=Hyalangium versicolor TaxID=2861190 RepID=UPI00281672E8|nr:DofB protein [Hyalangium versicolor]